MADSYVCSGATMRCSMGTSQAKLTVLPSRTIFLTGQPMANISDHLSMVNLAPFGRCRSLGFPATASATAAAHGKLTPMPCMHNTPFPWMGGKNDYIIKGDPALLKSSTCSCMWGGTISITDDGQHGEGTQWVQKETQECFNHNQENSEQADNAFMVSNQASSSKVSNTNTHPAISSSKVKIKPATAELILSNFTKYHPAVQERIINMANEMPDSLNIQERLKLSEHNFRIEKAIGKRKGKRMSMDEADKQSANPKHTNEYIADPKGEVTIKGVKYRKNPAYDRQFSINCATTSAAYALRLQGFDVKAKGNSKNNPLNKWLSEGNSFKIWKNTDGTEAKPILVKEWMKSKTINGKSINEMTPSLYKSYIEENTKEEGVYILTLAWKGDGGGHATIVQRWRDKDGNLQLSRIEPQVYNKQKGVTRSMNELYNAMTSNPPDNKGIMRVDNKLFDTNYSGLFE